MQSSRNKNVEKRAKLIMLLANQFVSYREFSNRFISTVRELNEAAHTDDLRAIQVQLSQRFPNIFKAETVSLWINNALTGFLYTVDKNDKDLTCFPGKGNMSQRPPSLHHTILSHPSDP